jgi:histidinol-phosphate aminotransferase
MLRPPLTPIAAALPSTVPFVGPEAQERARGRPFRARLGANESGFGPSSRVVERMRAAAPGMWKYCDPENHDLRVALAGHYGLKPENIAIDKGIDGVLETVCRLYVSPGTPVVTSLGAYPTFNYHVAVSGGTIHAVPFRDDREDLDGMLAKVGESGAPLVYLSNPDNPMGTWWEADAVMAFANALPQTTMLLLDEAYGETAPASALPALDVSQPNVLRIRTFSKAYGLAGLRCGYAIGEQQTIGAFDKVRNQYGMSRMAQEACVAALSDQDWLGVVAAKVAACRDRIAAIGQANGLTPINSATNFVTIDCGRDGAYAKRILDGLLERDVFIRKPMAPVLDRCIRVSCGPEDEIALFEAMLPLAIAAAQG